MKKCCWLYAGERIATYSACLIGKTVSELVDDFNSAFEQVHAQDRVYFRQAVLQAIGEHGIDVAAVEDKLGDETKIAYDAEERRLVVKP